MRTRYIREFFQAVPGQRSTRPSRSATEGFERSNWTTGPRTTLASWVPATLRYSGTLDYLRQQATCSLSKTI